MPGCLGTASDQSEPGRDVLLQIAHAHPVPFGATHPPAAILSPGSEKRPSFLEESVHKVPAAQHYAIGEAADPAIATPVMVDAAHCGDSDPSIPENQALSEQIAAVDEFSVIHASAKTTRGCLSTDDGWIGALLSSAAKSGKPEFVFVQLFHHEDPRSRPAPPRSRPWHRHHRRPQLQPGGGRRPRRCRSPAQQPEGAKYAGLIHRLGPPRALQQAKRGAGTGWNSGVEYVLC